jgi:hypothetical protein
MKFFLTVHPASVRYNKILYSTLENDLLTLAKMYKANPKLPYRDTIRKKKVNAVSKK